ncbi:MAG: threonylcarbamoyl-AMP synthase, partial [Clostridia bacterium]|nr:threonylcarbamoyl-AMP synthase [Clostridia bacterium]
MITRVLPAEGEAILLAGKLIAQGQLVGFPTETVYGLGGNALDEQAVRNIFAAKGRPADNPLIVHVSAWEETEALCEVNALSKRLMDAFWPGPLTLLLPKKAIVPDVTTAGLSTVAVRCPAHAAARALIRAAN